MMSDVVRANELYGCGLTFLIFLVQFFVCGAITIQTVKLCCPVSVPLL